MTPQRFKALLAEYGQVALFTYFAIFILVLVGFAVAIAAGVKPDSMTSNAGVLGGAYIAAKLTQPLRIAATLVLTPIVARVWRKARPPTENQSNPDEPAASPPGPSTTSPRPE